MTYLLYLSILLALLIVELLYFKIADHFNIIDKPNQRSSHATITLRGGGIIFPLAAIFFYLSSSYQFPYFILALLAISLISFLDDILTLNNKIRVVFHLLAVFLLFYQWNLFFFNWYWAILLAIVVIGTINAYNFMDGINGITGAYSLVAVASLYYINETIIAFTSSHLLIVVGLSLLVFNFFNFRKKAKCFAGDVGSVSIAFVIIFLIGQLILKTENFLYIALLLIYGLDAVSTIVFRLIRKENIFEAHRSHFYQYLANEKKWSHLLVSMLYAGVQIGINAVLISFFSYSLNFPSSLFYLFILILITGLSFVLIRITIEGKSRLLNGNTNFN